MVCASISPLFQFHTMTDDPIQPLTRISGFLGWNFTAQGVRGWPTKVYSIISINTHVLGVFFQLRSQLFSLYDLHVWMQIYNCRLLTKITSYLSFWNSIVIVHLTISGYMNSTSCIVNYVLLKILVLYIFHKLCFRINVEKLLSCFLIPTNTYI